MRAPDFPAVLSSAQLDIAGDASTIRQVVGKLNTTGMEDTQLPTVPLLTGD